MISKLPLEASKFLIKNLIKVIFPEQLTAICNYQDRSKITGFKDSEGNSRKHLDCGFHFCSHMRLNLCELHKDFIEGHITFHKNNTFSH